MVDITRVMGLDIGDSRIGVALSDPLRIMATPLTIIKRTEDIVAIQKIIDIIRKKGVGLIVAGMPLNMDGTAGPQADKTRYFITALGSQVDIPIKYRDERLTTVTAREMLGETRKTGRNTRYDAAAAAVILQSYLNESAPDTVPPEQTE